MICVPSHTEKTKRGDCAECNRARARLWGEKNKEKMKARGDRWREENRAKDLQTKRAWHQENKARMNEMSAAYYAANKEAILEQGRVWHLKNAERARANRRNRKARIKGSPEKHTGADIAALKELQRHRCAYCRASLKDAKSHVDHIMPIILGGSNGRANLQLLCAPCNLSKGPKHPIEYAQKIGRLL